RCSSQHAQQLIDFFKRRIRLLAEWSVLVLHVVERCEINSHESRPFKLPQADRILSTALVATDVFILTIRIERHLAFKKIEQAWSRQLAHQLAFIRRSCAPDLREIEVDLRSYRYRPMNVGSQKPRFVRFVP